MIRVFAILVFIFILQESYAQKFATKIIPINDTTINQFRDVNELYFLYGQHSYQLKKLVRKLSKTTHQSKADAIIKDIASIRNPEAAVILTLDKFFKNKKPLAGTNVENVIRQLSNSRAYYLLNENFYQSHFDQNLPIEKFKQKIQDSLGWAYGYGAFYYLSPEDSLYLAKMKKINVDNIDEQVEDIIEKYLAEYTSPFRYDINAILKEIKAITYVKDAQYDGCLTKTLQLPNWDAIGIVIVKGNDTVERVYSIQYGYYKMFRLGRCISFPLKSKGDVLFYKGVEYGLHFVALTRAQCEENERRHQESMKQYEEWKKNKQ